MLWSVNQETCYGVLIKRHVMECQTGDMFWSVKRCYIILDGEEDH